MIVDRLLSAVCRRPRWRFVLGMIVGLLGGLSRVQASQSVELTWAPSASAGIVAYQVFYGTQSGVYPNSITFGNVSNVIVPGLASGVTYYFAVAAIDADNLESVLSPATVYTTPGPQAIQITAQPDTNAVQAVNLSWTASIDPDVFGYQIDYGSQSGKYTNSVACYYTTNAIISGLAAGVTYYFAVSPIDSLGVEPVASDEAVYAVPAPPSLQLRAQMPANSAGVELTWNPVLNEGITSYYVYYGTQSGVYSSSVNAGDVTDFVLLGLTPGQIYYCAVAPVDAYGNQGPLSNEASSPAAAPAPIPLQVQASSQALEAVDLSWPASPDTNVFGYAIGYWVAGTDSTNYQEFYFTTDATISGLAPGQTYNFAIAPIDWYGLEAVASKVVSCTVPVPQPISLAAQTLATSPAVELTWNAVPNQGVVGYNVYYGTQSGAYSSSTSCGNVTDFIVPNLYGGQTFYFVVAAVDDYGNQGPLSNEASATTLPPAPASLTFQLYYDETGQPYLMEINTPSTVTGPWELDSSSDLRNWTSYATGYGSGYGNGYDVDVYVSIDPTQPQMLYRLRQ